MNILVADDDELILEFLERSLRQDKHIVNIARDGNEALQKATDRSYDILIIDIVMPHKDGITLCKELRKTGVETPLILLTSADDENSRVEGLDSGADDYLTKPFSYRELEARIRAVTRRPQTLNPATITAGGGMLSLDSARKVIHLNGTILELRPKEYALLEYLMRHADKVIPKEELLENLWHISATNASNRLEVCMHHIRSKINSKRQILKTVRGYGYIIEG